MADQLRISKKKYKTGTEKRNRKRKQDLERAAADKKQRRLFEDDRPIKKSKECDDSQTLSSRPSNLSHHCQYNSQNAGM